MINLDDPYGAKLVARLDEKQSRLTYGESPEADVRATEIEYGFKNTKLTVIWPQGSRAIESPLIGRYNLSNLLAAVATVIASGRKPEDFLNRLNTQITGTKNGHD